MRLTKQMVTALTLMILALCLSTSSLVQAQEPSVTIEPTELVVPSPGETFTIDVTLNDVTQWSWACTVSFNSDAAECTGFEAGPFNPSGTDAVGFIDNDSGTITGLAGFHLDAETVTGSGVILTLEFMAKDSGSSENPASLDLQIFDVNYMPEAQTSPPTIDAIDIPENQIQQANVTVIPEFPTILMVPLFLIATAIVVITTKRIRAK